MWFVVAIALHFSVVSGAAAGVAPVPATTGAAPKSTINARIFDIPDPAEGGQGGQVYLARCASCHDLGLDRAPQRVVLALMSPQSIYRALTQGVMARSRRRN